MQRLPVGHVQLDSWWYYKDAADSGVLTWEPRTDALPSGMDAAVLNHTPLVLHNRFFSPASPYVRRYEFLRGDGVAIPMDPAFWTALLQRPVRQWGMATYEQDFLVTAFTKAAVLRSNMSAALTWLSQMDAAALSLQVRRMPGSPLPSPRPPPTSRRARQFARPCGSVR